MPQILILKRRGLAGSPPNTVQGSVRSGCSQVPSGGLLKLAAATSLQKACGGGKQSGSTLSPRPFIRVYDPSLYRFDLRVMGQDMHTAITPAEERT